MKDKKQTELKVGITVIVSIIILLWVLGWAKNFSFNSNQKSLSISFENVAGLLVGDPVSVQGIKEGFVKNIYNKNNSVIVDITLSESVNLKEDAKFSILMIDLMGGKKVEIYPGTSSNEIDYSKIQQGEFLGDISTTMASLGSVQNDLVEVIYEIKQTLKTFNKIMDNPEFVDELQASVKNLNQLILKTDKIISNNSAAISELINKSNDLVANSNQFILDNKEEIQSSINNINGLVQNTDALILKLTDFMNEVENKENNLGKIIYDEEIINNLSEALKELKDLTKTFNKQINNKGLKVDADIF